MPESAEPERVRQPEASFPLQNVRRLPWRVRLLHVLRRVSRCTMGFCLLDHRFAERSDRSATFRPAAASGNRRSGSPQRQQTDAGGRRYSASTSTRTSTSSVGHRARTAEIARHGVQSAADQNRLRTLARPSGGDGRVARPLLDAAKRPGGAPALPQPCDRRRVVRPEPQHPLRDGRETRAGRAGIAPPRRPRCPPRPRAPRPAPAGAAPVPGRPRSRCCARPAAAPAARAPNPPPAVHGRSSTGWSPAPPPPAGNLPPRQLGREPSARAADTPGSAGRARRPGRLSARARPGRPGHRRGSKASRRSGGAAWPGDAGAALPDLLRQTRHTSTQVALAYLCPADLWRNNVTQIVFGESGGSED